MNNIDKNKKESENKHSLLDQKGINIVTVAIAVTCVDGVVIGVDRKVTMSRGTNIKSLQNKVYSLSFKDVREFLACGAGSTECAKRGIDSINPSDYDSLEASVYKDMVENKISRLRQGRLSLSFIRFERSLIKGIAESKVSLPIYHVGISFESAHMAVHV